MTHALRARLTIKVFCPVFFRKLAGSKGGALGRSSQRAKSCCFTRFFFGTFFCRHKKKVREHTAQLDLNGRWTMDDETDVLGFVKNDTVKSKQPFFLFVATKERIKEKTRQVVRFRSLRRAGFRLLRQATKGAALGSCHFSEENWTKDFNCQSYAHIEKHWQLTIEPREDIMKLPKNLGF